MRCEEMMKTDVTCIRSDETVRDAARRMRDGAIGFLPVCDESGKPVGAITDRDIVLRVVAEDHPSKTTVREVMSTTVVHCRPDDDLRMAERLMARNQKSRIMVIDDGGRLVGVISLSDIAESELSSDRTAKTMREISSRETRPPPVRDDDRPPN